MNIPIQIPLMVNPSIDPLSHSTIYTFPESSKSNDTDGNMLLRFPYSRNTYWTNFNYHCFDFKDTLQIEVMLITADGYTYSISPRIDRNPDEWYDTNWVLPSINTGEHSGIFLRISKPINELKHFRFNLLGFTDLYPDVENYLLMTPLKSYQFIFSKFMDVENNRSYGTIYNVEHTDYIRGVIDTAQKIDCAF